jgi:DNA-binding winged helix-turn-helix (wHTH) protein
MSLSSNDLYRFDGFTIDAEQRVLLRGEDRIHLTPKALDILIALVRRPGQVVDKETLMREVWPDTFVEDINLAYNIHILRKALSARSEADVEYIETVPKRGYRFVPRETGEPPEASDDYRHDSTPLISSTTTREAHVRPASPIQTPLGLVALLTFTILLIASVSVFYSDTRTRVTPVPAAAPSQVSLTGSTDVETDARNITALLVEERFSELANRFDGSLRQSLKPRQMTQVWKGVKEEGGSFQQIVRVNSRKEHRFDVVEVFCQFEKAMFVLQITFNARAEITALWLLPANNPVSDGSSEDALTAEMKGRAREVATQLVNRSFDEIPKGFDERLRSNLTPRVIHHVWASVTNNIGSFQRIGDVKRSFDFVDVKVQFLRGVLNVRVGFDSERKISGLFVTRLPGQ